MIIALLAAGDDSVGLTGQESAPLRVVLLKNGQVLTGRTTFVGEQCIVEMDNGVSVRLARRDIATDCLNLLEAYHFQRRTLTSSNRAKPHLDLARWCLRFGLLEQAAEEVLTAMQIEPNHPGIDPLVRQLQQATQPSRTTAPPDRPPETNVGPLSALDSLDQLAKGVPQPALSLFASRVQPLLVNRCGGSACHTGNRAGEFRLLEPPRGGTYFRRLTLRNLETTLAHIHRDAPEDSQLLRVAQEPHGPTRIVAISGPSDPLYQLLIDWCQKLRGAQAPDETLIVEQSPVEGAPIDIAPRENPATTEVSDRTSPQPDQYSPTHSSNKSAPVSTVNPRGSASAPPRSVSVRHQAPSTVPPALPIDPFDPTLFNRKIHGRP